MAGESPSSEVGEPGLLGVWKVSSKRCKPPAAPPLDPNAAAKGVGSGGIAAIRELVLNPLLKGVLGERSDASSRFVADMLRLRRLLRLDDE
jgi:hypothetical protein